MMGGLIDWEDFSISSFFCFGFNLKGNTKSAFSWIVYWEEVDKTLFPHRKVLSQTGSGIWNLLAKNHLQLYMAIDLHHWCKCQLLHKLHTHLDECGRDVWCSPTRTQWTLCCTAGQERGSWARKHEAADVSSTILLRICTRQREHTGTQAECLRWCLGVCV